MVLRKFRISTLLIAMAIVAHACVKPEWGDAMCADGSQVERTWIPFVIQTSFDRGDIVRHTVNVGALGFYFPAFSMSADASSSGTRYCYLPEIQSMQGSLIDVSIVGTRTKYVRVSGNVIATDSLTELQKIIGRHDWGNVSQLYWDVTCDDGGSLHGWCKVTEGSGEEKR